jgi:hypothetical protein
MMFSSNTFRFVLALATTCNAVTYVIAEQVVDLGFAGNYVILTKAGISTAPSSDIVGDNAVPPIAATAITSLSLTADLTNNISTSAQLRGATNPKALAANYAVPTPPALTIAVSNMEDAYADAEGRAATATNLGGGALEGHVLTIGVYKFDSDVTIGNDIYFQGTTIETGPTDVFIIQTTGNLIQVADTRVHLLNGALAKNIFWQVTGHVEVGEGAHLKGILLVKTDVLFETGSSLNGRVLAQTRCDLEVGAIIEPTC